MAQDVWTCITYSFSPALTTGSQESSVSGGHLPVADDGDGNVTKRTDEKAKRVLDDEQMSPIAGQPRTPENEWS